ncbi:ribonuclease domain-containing protein [Streptomyces cylindrosporus]|uniref:Ribonuclease N n=1 Tax=Streptomyces cylindrosporus TaxID=2927583 RepID=A0ABS9YJF0_9ACTN|nr:ribonuclease domain-containing protein [Streptomyces cylindrosporus]MCI3277378.1 ribonuclease N [Streptomyces cylindrosporus]
MLLRFVPRVLLCVLAVVVLGCSSATGSAPARTDGMATVRVSQLPSEARQTLALIDKGGPYPYARDGAVFGNFEGLLPGHRRGYYHEYTVRTPGSPDRGARRIVTGQGGEIYYTDDHYDSFRAVLR